MSSGGQTSGLESWVYVPSELTSNVPSNYFVRLDNWIFTPMNKLQSRPGLEPISYFINSSTPNIESLLGLITPNVVVSEVDDIFLNDIETATLELFGDSLIFSGPNASSFHIVPFSLKADATSKHYEYIAKDVNGVEVPGDSRGGFHLYKGKPLFWNGRGTYQMFANAISESNFTRLGNNIVPLEDQTVIDACTFENRLVVATLQGYLMWSQPDWDGTSVWQDSEGSATNYLQIVTDPGEIIEFMTTFRGGIILSTRKSSNVSGRIININTLNPESVTVTDTGVDSFFTRNSLIASTDTLVGICPQGVIGVSYDSLARSAKTEFSQSAPIIEYLNEIFSDNTIFPYLDAHLDTKTRKGYFIHDWSTDMSRDTIMLAYDYNSDKWSRLITSLPIQKVFQMYDHLCCAGWIRTGNRVSLGIWSFSDINTDIMIEPIISDEYTYWSESRSIKFLKRFVTGAHNTAEVGPGEVPGSSRLPKQLLFSTTDPATYKIFTRTYSKDSWGGKSSDFLDFKMNDNDPLECWSTGSLTSAKWDITLKNHEYFQRYAVNIPNMNLYYQILFESYDDTRFTLHSILRNKHNIS